MSDSIFQGVFRVLIRADTLDGGNFWRKLLGINSGS
jgi:hypothetical protein